MKPVALAALALAACVADTSTDEAPLACGDAPGLHVTVSLAGSCDTITPNPADGEVVVVTTGVSLAAAAATERRYPDRVEYLWRWPADAVEGARAGFWWRTSAGATHGQVDGAFVVARDQCVEASYAALCY